MFKKKKATEVKKVIDVKFEVKVSRMYQGFLKGLQMGRREKCR